MAWSKKKDSGRKEPKFGLAAAMSELRLNPLDRIASAEDDKPKKKAAARRADGVMAGPGPFARCR